MHNSENIFEFTIAPDDTRETIRSDNAIRFRLRLSIITLPKNFIRRKWK